MTTPEGARPGGAGLSPAPLAQAPLTIAARGGYAARLVRVGGEENWCPERWTLDGPEPYAVRLPAGQPEEADTQVRPLADGRVFIARHADGRYLLALLYPSGPETGELPLGAVECELLTVLPPAPDGARVYALAPRPDGSATALWLVCGGAFGPELVTVLAGGCSGGVWLDAAGRLLALDRADEAGRTRAVTVDVEHGGEPTELLRIAEDSNDRLLAADPDSGLLLVRSDAPGEERVGWGVLGSHRPVRFPEALHPGNGVRVAPFAMRPGQVLLPEACAVALRVTTAEGADWPAVWQPGTRELRHLPAPPGWLPGTGLLTADGWLLLPYETPATPCGLARLPVPDAPHAPAASTAPPPSATASGPAAHPDPGTGPDFSPTPAGDAPPAPGAHAHAAPAQGPTTPGASDAPQTAGAGTAAPAGAAPPGGASAPAGTGPVAGDERAAPGAHAAAGAQRPGRDSGPAPGTEPFPAGPAAGGRRTTPAAQPEGATAPTAGPGTDESQRARGR
ncbi:hypothetical protein RM780_03825 [Streptomyces sp. DSM 44917]|uniref:Uncharacterized protein n=1 Tax=Streptomyces boetiae TaxID=3075541 RepID=A0ABU2L3E7_9ACTN|nr:hypothetical protein [Streptomyces sp. DSM 44917]MDT0306092.1 hypothetical protein [Streptomyces sp. DSM 44917]